MICAADAGGSRSVDLEALRRKRAERPQPARPPPAPARKVYSQPRPTREQLQLNADIKACASADAVLDLVSSRLAVLNEVNASTALIIIQRCTGKRAAWLKSDPRFAQLLSAAESLFDSMAPQNLANTLYACGQLSIMPPAKWMQRFWHVSTAKLGDFDPQAFSNTLYACGQLSITPPAEWMQRFWHASSAKVGDFVPQALSNTLYACGQLGVTPPDAWLGRFWLASALKLGDFKPQELSNTLYACGQLGISPPTNWLERFWHASASVLGSFTVQGLSNTIYACGQLAISPPADWLERFWLAGASILNDFLPQALSNTLYACGQLGITPPADWLDCFWHSSASKLSAYNSQELCNTLLACGLLDTRPPADWLELFSTACEHALPDTTQQGLANTAFAVAMLQLWELPLWHSLWARLCSSLPRDIAGWSAEDRLQAMQMYQAYQAAVVERPGLLAAPSHELLAAARKSWINGLDTDIDRTSQLHDGVSACLKRMGMAHTNERWCERAERSIDIAIEGAVPVALEVDGPHHFLQDGRPEGSTLLRNRMLAAHGWRVAMVDYRVWQHELQTPEQQEQHLRGLLG